MVASALSRSFYPSVNEHGHPLQPRLAHPLFTRLSLPRRVGSPGCRGRALCCRLTSREPLRTLDFATVSTNSPDQLDTVATQVATFNVGSRITAIAWSSRTVSPSLSDDWSIESVETGISGGLDSSSHRSRGIGWLWRRPTLESTCSQSLPLVLRRFSRSAAV